MTTPFQRAAPLALAALLAAAPLAAQPTVRLPAADRPLAGTPTQVFAVGAEEGQSWEMLSNVSSVVFDANDNLYVLDEGNKRVLMFDRSGRFVRQLGKRGGGPGEFEMPIGITTLPNGGLAVFDLAHRSFSLFGPDGAFQRTSPWDEQWGMPGGRIVAHPAGGVVSVLRPSLRAQLERGQAPQNRPRRLTFARVPASGSGSIARLFEIDDPATVTGSTSNEGGGQRVSIRMSRPPEFSPLVLWGVLPDGGTALSHTSLYTIKVQDANGRTVRFLQRPVAVRRPTDRDKERARERALENIRSGRGFRVVTIGGGGGPSDAQIRAQAERDLENMTFADTIRAVQGLTVAPSGKLWIERTPQEVGSPGPIDIVTPQGQYLGTISGQRLPAAISASGRAAYIDRDDLGVERVIVRQLPAAWR